MLGARLQFVFSLKAVVHGRKNTRYFQFNAEKYVNSLSVPYLSIFIFFRDRFLCTKL